jgi:hypothetical protein
VAGEKPEREDFAEALVAVGLAAVTPVLRAVLVQVLKGRV